MDDRLRSVCEEFIANRDMLRDTFKNEGMVPHLIGASLLCTMEERPDSERLLECEGVLKKHEGIFSPFRGALKLPVLINMAASDDPENYLKKVRGAYDLICEKKGRRDERYYLPAMAIASAAENGEDMSEAVESSDAFLDDERSIDDLLYECGLSGDELAARTSDAEEFLKGQKGFGFMGAGSEMRRLFARLLVCIAYEFKNGAYDIAAGEAISKAIESRYIALQITKMNMM